MIFVYAFYIAALFLYILMFFEWIMSGWGLAPKFVPIRAIKNKLLKDVVSAISISMILFSGLGFLLTIVWTVTYFFVFSRYFFD